MNTTFRSAVLLTLPVIIFVALLFVLPVAMLLLSSFGLPDQNGDIVPSLAAYDGIWNVRTAKVFLTSLAISLSVALLTTAIGLQFALIVNKMRPTAASLLTVVLFLPLATSEIVIGYGWLIILGRNGIVNMVLQGLGLISAPLSLLYSPAAVIVGLTGLLLPFSTLPILTALSSIDSNLYLAGQSLGASRLRMAFEITFPLVRGAMLSGAAVVYALAMSAFAIPSVLGGQRVQTAPLNIYINYINLFDHASGSAVACMLLILVMIPILLFARGKNLLTGRV